MAILNEYELHLLAMMSGIDEHATIDNKQSLLVALDVLKPQENMSDADYAAEINKTLNKALDEQYAKPLANVSVCAKTGRTALNSSFPPDTTTNP